MAETQAPGPPSLPISVTEVRRHLGTRLPVERSFEAHDLGLSDVRVADGSDVELDGVVESISEGVVLTGTVTVSWVGACRRCLETVSGRSPVPVREVFEAHPTDGETWPMVNDQIDVGPLLHDTALLALPLAPLCGDDCQGPDPATNPTGPGAEGPGGSGPDPAGEAVRDPRWAALDDLDL